MNISVIPLVGWNIFLNKLVTLMAFSVVGVVVLAAFGPRSLAVTAQLFADPSTPYDGGNSRFVWATLGVFVFATSEAIFLFAGWPTSRVVAAVVGRIAQIAGFGIGSFALFSGMVEFRSMALPGGLPSPEEISVNFNRNATILTVGLCIAVLGQLVVAISRHNNSIVTNPHRREPKTTFLKKSLIIGFVLVLLSILGLFVFTTIFELELLGKLKQSNQIDLAFLANDLQGMMIYPFLAYLLAIFYCLADGVRVVVAKPISLSPSNAE